MSGLPELCQIGEANQTDGMKTCLMVAAQQGNEAAVELLLQQPDLDVNLMDSVGYTALHFASSSGQLGVVGRLLEHPSLTCLNARNSYGSTALMMALMNNHLKCVELLAEQEGVDMDTRKRKLSLDQLEELAQEPWQQEALGAAREIIRVVKGDLRMGLKSGRRGRKKEEERSGEEAIRRQEAREEMSDDKIDEIVHFLDATTMSKKNTKKKKAKKGIQNVNAHSHNKNNHKVTSNISANDQIETTDSDSELNDLELNVDHENADANLSQTLKDKIRVLENEKVHAHSMENRNIKELSHLTGTIANIEESMSRVLEEIAQIDSRKSELLSSCEAKNIVLNRLRTEQETLKGSMSIRSEASRAKISQLESEVKALELRQLGTTKTSRSSKVVHQNKEYLASISLKICCKEQELECPVCLETATAPILMCKDQHLICNQCR